MKEKPGVLPATRALHAETCNWNQIAAMIARFFEVEAPVVKLKDLP